MRRQANPFLIAGGLLLLCLAIIASAHRITMHEATVEVAAEDFDMPEVFEEKEPAIALEENRARRPVAEDAVTALGRDEAFERVEARDQPTPPLTKADVWQPKLLYRPAATAAGRFQAQGYQIEIEGLEPLELAETCGNEAESWPCGAVARTQFRNLIRGRALSCVVPPATQKEAIIARCTVGGEDVGAWLVSQGWARATPDGPLAEQGEAARDARRGIWGAGPEG